MSRITCCVVLLVAASTLSYFGCADTRPRGLSASQPDRTGQLDSEGTTELPSKVKKSRNRYVQILKAELRPDSGLSPEVRREVAVLLGREGCSDGIKFLVHGLLAAAPLDNIDWVQAIKRSVVDEDMLKQLYETRDIESQLGAVMIMSVTASPRHRERLRTLFEDGRTDIRVRHSAMYALAANASWKDVRTIARVATSGRLPESLQNGARKSLARYLGNDPGTMTVREFRTFVTKVLASLPADESATR